MARLPEMSGIVGEDVAEPLDRAHRLRAPFLKARTPRAPSTATIPSGEIDQRVPARGPYAGPKASITPHTPQAEEQPEIARRGRKSTRSEGCRSDDVVDQELRGKGARKRGESVDDGARQRATFPACR